MITISLEDALQEDMRELIAELNALLLSLTPAENCSHLTVEQMAGESVKVFVARESGIAIACGALKIHENGIGEVKRMYVRPAQQGKGVGSKIMIEIELTALELGLKNLVLETGHQHPWAWRLYEKHGFCRCGPILNYPDSEYSVFYEKELAKKD